MNPLPQLANLIKGLKISDVKPIIDYSPTPPEQLMTFAPEQNNNLSPPKALNAGHASAASSAVGALLQTSRDINVSPIKNDMLEVLKNSTVAKIMDH